ncbi:hypothetical protein ADK43_02870 [Streptomyces rimosus subsp. rimosus]|nr:hypothetical protein ADK43_02870 [Streptomyces rimosus subsp. rimosus]
MSTAEQRTIVPAPAGWRRSSSTNRSTASIPSLRPSGPWKTTSEVSAWASSVVTRLSSEALKAERNVSMADCAVSSCMHQ